MTGLLTVVRPGLQTLVVDAGRPGLAHLGVPRSGALDPAALARANALVGNAPDAAGLECLLRGPVLTGPHRLAAAAPGWETTRHGSIDLARLPCLRVWVAVAGGLETPVVLGSRSADLLGRLGPGPLRQGDPLPVGHDPAITAYDGAGLLPDTPAEPALALLPGPDTLPLAPGPWTMLPASDRTALRLTGPAVPHTLPGRTRGLVPGAVQVPPDGRPVVFLAGHPTTGGYPVTGFVRSRDLAALAQLRPGSRLRFR